MPTLPLTGAPPAIPRPGPSRGAESTIHAYGQVVPVVYGSGVVRGFLAYAPETPIPGIGAVATVSEGGVVSFATNQSKKEIVYAPAEYIFAQGPISAWRFIQRGTIKFADGSSVPLNLMLAVTEGTPPTWNDPELTTGTAATVADWSYAAAKAVAHRVQFGHYAALRTPFLIFPDGEVPDLRAGIDGRCATVTFSYGGVDYKGSPPADMLKDMAENALLGMGLPAGTVITSAGTDGGAASSFDRYMTARGWVLARSFDAVAAGDEAFAEVLAACDATCLWDGANLRIIPLCESAVGTYAPATTAYAFTDDEFVPASEGEDPIEAERIPESDIATVVPVEFGPVYSPDGSTATVEAAEVARSLWGTLATRRGEKLSLPCIPIESHAKAISELAARRSVYNRTRFRWTASWRHIAVQPGDFVTLTHSMMGLSGTVALVEKVEETNDGLRFEAVEWFPGISLDIQYTPQPPSGVGTNPLVPPDLGRVNEELASMSSDGTLSQVEKPSFFNIAGALWWRIHSLTEAPSTEGGDIRLVDTGPLVTAFLAFKSYLATIGFDWSWCAIDHVWAAAGDRTTQRGLLAAWMAIDTTVVAGDFRDAFVAIETAVKAAEYAESTNIYAAASATKRGMVKVGSGLSVADDGTLSSSAGGGTVTNVSGTAPISVTNPTTTPGISISNATPSAAGAMSAADKSKLDALPPKSGVDYATNPVKLWAAAADNGDLTAVSKSVLTWPWSAITSRPTTLSGYGITDAASSSHTHSNATSSAAGFMAAADKSKLDGIASGATANAGTVTSIATTAPITGGTITGSGTIGISAATTSAAGSMSAADKVKLNDLPTKSGVDLSTNPTKFWSTADNTDLTAVPKSYVTWPWSQITSRPTTLSGYGITDALSSTGKAADSSLLNGLTGSTSATASTLAVRDANGWLYCVDLSTSSDRRTKRKVRNLRGALARVLGLRGVSFYRKGDKTKAPRIGLIAQEAREVVPEVVVEDADGMLSVSYGSLVALIVEALREIVKRLERLEARH